MQVLASLDSQATDPAACLLSGLRLEQGQAGAAWELLRCCLAAACSSNAGLVLSAVQALYDQRCSYEEVSLPACLPACLGFAGVIWGCPARG
jgi:hypothetical protein